MTYNYTEHDMQIDQFLTTGSDYLKKEDVDKPVLATISGADVEQVGDEDKIIIHFKEIDKSLVANKTNLQLMAVFYGSSDTDAWIGKQVVLFNDKTVMYAGQVVGGVRVRLPKGVEPVGEKEFDDDVPF
jgi:sucrose-6-phosphate hydrolase SacC (GH32 family)